MSLSRKLDRALDEAVERGQDRGTVQAEDRGARAELDLDGAGPIGARVRRVRVTHATPRDVAGEAERLAGGLDSLGERVEPVEVAPELRGAVLRTDPEDMDEGRYYEVGVTPGDTRVVRRRVVDGQRRSETWDMTREQLGRLVDALEDA